jgi:hypothetical protein
MAESTLSVSELLGLPAEDFPGGILRAGISSDELAAFQNRIQGALKGMPSSHLEAAVSSKLSEVLDVDPVELIAGAWGKYKLLADAAEQSRSGETVLVPLAEHAMALELRPWIEIQLGPQILRRIDLHVTLALTLKGVIVRVETEMIRAFEAGSCEGSGEIAVSEVPVWKHEIKPIDLPGRVRLEKGIRIRSA